MATKQEQFYSEVYAGARERGMSDAQARLAASQASLETGYGRSMPGGNMFGIKAGKSWKGPTQNLNTWEDQGGRVNIVDKFRSYENPFDSLGDWASTVGRRWSGAMEARDFPSAVSALNAGGPGGYATDRGYNGKLHSIDERFSDAAVQNYGLMGKDVPTPSPAGRGVLSEPSWASAAPAAVQRENLAAPQSASFDMARFGDVPSAQGFDTARFGTATTATPVAELRDAMARQTQQQQQTGGLLGSAMASQASPGLAEQYSQYGVGQGMLQDAMAAKNLSLDVAANRNRLGLAPVSQPAAQPGYVDPSVSTVNAPQAQPAQPAQAVSPSYASPSSAGPGPSMAASPAASMTAADAQRIERALSTRQMLGGLIGGLGGGLLGGPAGGLLGGFAGRQIGARTYYPDAPKGGSSGVGIGKESLNDRGRDTYSKSGQFRDAVDKKSNGLW